MSDNVTPSAQVVRPRRRRWLGLLFVGVVLVSAAVAARLYYFPARPVGSGPAGPAVDITAFAEPWTTRPVLLLGVGDSVTAGFGASQGKSYFARLVDQPADDFEDVRGRSLRAVLPNLTVLNISVSGSTSLEHVIHLEDRLPKLSAETFGVVVMTSGGNDIIHSYGRLPAREGAMYGATMTQAEPWIAAFEVRMNAMLDTLNQRFPGGCAIYLADIYDPTDGVGDAQNAGLPKWSDGLQIHTAYNEVIRRIAAARDNVYMVPMHATFIGHGIHCTQSWRDFHDAADPHYWYHVNLEDPNDRGYDALRRIFLNTMIESRGDWPAADVNVEQ